MTLRSSDDSWAAAEFEALRKEFNGHLDSMRSSLADMEAMNIGMRQVLAEPDPTIWGWLKCVFGGHRIHQRRMLHVGSVGGVQAVATWASCNCGRDRSVVETRRFRAPFAEQRPPATGDSARC